MSTTRYFTHVDGFGDGTAYIEVGDFRTRLVGESGAREDSTWTLDECVENCREKVWKEISEADVLALNIPAAPVEPRDAQIAALAERLRIVEAERDALIKDVLAIVPEPLQPKVSGESPSWHAVAAVANLNARRLNHEAELSALRAELERKDAALKSIKHLDDLEAHQLSQTSWKWLCDKLNAALQPKEPPCQTA